MKKRVSKASLSLCVLALLTSCNEKSSNKADSITIKSKEQANVAVEVEEQSDGIYLVGKNHSNINQLCSLELINDDIAFTNYLFEAQKRHRYKLKIKPANLASISSKISMDLKCKSVENDSELQLGIASLILNKDYDNINYLYEYQENPSSMKVINLSDTDFSDSEIINNLKLDYNLVDINISKTPAEAKLNHVNADKSCQQRQNSLCGYNKELSASGDFIVTEVRFCDLEINEDNFFKKCSYTDATERLLEEEF